MKSVPKISDTEWEIMRVVWAEHPLAASEIVERLIAEDATWHPKTARTLLARLVRKGALAYEAEGRAYVYRPLVNQSECVGAASETFLDRVLGGSLRPMLAHFVERRKLSPEELAGLRKILEAGDAGAGEARKTRKPK